MSYESPRGLKSWDEEHATDGEEFTVQCSRCPNTFKYAPGEPSTAFDDECARNDAADEAGWSHDDVNNRFTCPYHNGGE